ncbi:MAG: sigma-54 dependent transcriptional regulator [bacterium]
MLVIHKMAQAAKILVIEDDPLVVAALEVFLKPHTVEYYKTLPEFINNSEDKKTFDLVLLDLCHDDDPEGLGSLELLPDLQKKVKSAEIVVQSGVNDIPVMRRSLQLGAKKYLLKDHMADELPILIDNSLESRQLRDFLDHLMIGNSKVMCDLKERLIGLRNQSNIGDVLIEGETGTGKELCAKALHRGGPFKALNVSAIPHDLFEAEFFGSEKGAYTSATTSRIGYLESVEDGVLFLDEIQSLAPAHQSKLLRLIETRCFSKIGSTVEKKFLGRIVSASNENLYEAVQKGTFREDLYFRLATTTVRVPPLRARGKDIENLVAHFLKTFQSKMTFTPKALKFLKESYDWPGNVRELKSVVRSLSFESKMPFVDLEEVEDFFKREGSLLKAQSLEASVSSVIPRMDLGFDENVEIFQKCLMICALSGKTQQQALESLKLSRSRFYEKLKQFGLS